MPRKKSSEGIPGFELTDRSVFKNLDASIDHAGRLFAKLNFVLERFDKLLIPGRELKDLSEEQREIVKVATLQIQDYYNKAADAFEEQCAPLLAKVMKLEGISEEAKDTVAERFQRLMNYYDTASTKIEEIAQRTR